MTTKKLLEVLKLVKFVNDTDWKSVMRLVEFLNKNKNVVVREIKWEGKNRYKNTSLDWYPINILKIETWSTFNDCVDILYSIENNKIICSATIWDGDMLDGYKTDKRFTVELEMPNAFVLTLEKDILRKLDFHLKKKYDEYLENQRKNWIETERKKILYNTEGI